MANKIQSTINREISWIYFNERVMQEAKDPATPLIERLIFLGIYSNNQDEFFKVRVATLNRILKYGNTDNYQELFSNPGRTLKEVDKKTTSHQRLL